MQKQRKRNNKIFIASSLRKIADQANEDETKYLTFRTLVYDTIYNAAKAGKYYMTINLAEYPGKYQYRLVKELKENGYIIEIYKNPSNYFGNQLGHGCSYENNIQICWKAGEQYKNNYSGKFSIFGNTTNIYENEGEYDEDDIRDQMVMQMFKK